MPNDATGGPSWEEIVNQVTIASNYFRLQQSAAGWDAAFQQIDKLRDDVKALGTQTGRWWRGGDADRFRGYVERLAEAVNQTAAQHRDVQQRLADCHRALEAAVRKIPIPSWKYAEVAAAQNRYAARGELAQVTPGTFWSSLEALAGAPLVGDAYRAAEEFFRNNTQVAQRAYAELATAYTSILQGLPQGTRVDVPRVDRSALAGAAVNAPGTQPGTRPGTTPGTQPGTQPGTTPGTQPGTQPGTTPGLTPGMTGMPPTQPVTANPGLPPPSTINPADLVPGRFGTDPAGPGTGLAGFDPKAGGGSDLAGLSGLGGAGGGKLGAGGLGGLGAGGLGAVPPIGPSVSLPPEVFAGAGRTDAARGARVAGVAGGAAATPGAVAAAGPMMGATGAGGRDGQAHDTHLSEQWEYDNDLPTGTIGV